VHNMDVQLARAYAREAALQEASCSMTGDVLSATTRVVNRRGTSKNAF
jgi:hypothetical protein